MINLYVNIKILELERDLSITPWFKDIGSMERWITVEIVKKYEYKLVNEIVHLNLKCD